MCLVLILSIVFVACTSGFGNSSDVTDHPAVQWFRQMNVELKHLNHEAALYAWESSTLATRTTTVEKIIQLTVRKAHWERKMCTRGQQHRSYNASLDRAFHLLCRSPQYSDEEISTIAKLLGSLQGIYTGTQICLDKAYDPCKGNGLLWDRTSVKHQDLASNKQSDAEEKDRICLYGEPEMEQIMAGSTDVKLLLHSGPEGEFSRQDGVE